MAQTICRLCYVGNKILSRKITEIPPVRTCAHRRDRSTQKIYLTARIISQVPEVEMVASRTGKPVMYSPQHCLDQATECERSISSAQTEAQAHALRNISQSWLRLASQIDRCSGRYPTKCLRSSNESHRPRRSPRSLQRPEDCERAHDGRSEHQDG